jgi:putative oxidoreductase
MRREPSFGPIEFGSEGPKVNTENGVLLQRLFSVFPNGWPGVGLLLQRVVVAAFLFHFGFGGLKETPPSVLILPHLISAGAGVSLLLGLWTPICGGLIASVQIWIAFSCDGVDGISILLATSGATLAMIGPGAWSIDARLFGRKHFEIPQR